MVDEESVVGGVVDVGDEGEVLHVVVDAFGKGFLAGAGEGDAHGVREEEERVCRRASA